MKGKSFIGAAILLRKHGGNEYAVLHLLCQGVENVLKSLLLLKDFRKYWPELPKKKTFGHDLNKLVEAVLSEFPMRPLSKELLAEISTLTTYYKNHDLRYGSIHDLFVLPDTISSKLTLRKICAVLRLANRHIAPQAKRMPPGEESGTS
jgi:hypothetical protein